MASARVLGTEGVRLADGGDCAGAIPKLEAAEKLYHAPSTLDRLGECQIKVGRLVDGTEALQRVVREPSAPTAPQAFVVARQRAQQALAAALPRIAKLRIHVDGAPPDQVAVTVDGASVPSALLDSDRPTDPGTHEIKATAPGFTTATATVQLDDGAGAPVSLHIDPAPSAPAAAPAPAPAPVEPPLPAPTSSSGGGRGLAIASLAVGGVGVAVGSIFGVLALSTKSTLDSHCPGKVCPPSEQGDIDSLGSQATVSSVGFGVGLVGLAVGAVLLVTSHGSAEAHADRGPPRPSVEPWVGAGAAGVGGTFQ